MVPARNLQLLRDAHGAKPAFVAVTAPPPPQRHHMAQEPINQEPPKQTPSQERQSEHHHQHQLPPQEERRQQQHLQPAGTSGSSSGGSSSNNGGGVGGAGHSRDWLSLGLGLGPSSPGGGPDTTGLDLFAAHRASAQHRQQETLPDMGMPPGAFLYPAIPGIPQASMQMPVPRAGLPWLPPWNPSPWNPSPWNPSPFPSQQPPLLLPFAHHGYYGPGSPAAGASVFDTSCRVFLPPPAATAAAGIWFGLQAAPHQGREPFLPQIPRNYLRIKDGRVTVRLVIKYLVNKLGLEDESEVEITCRGRPLLPLMTLQHVRDSLWCPSDVVSPSVAPSGMSTANHIMVLQYGRRP